MQFPKPLFNLCFAVGLSCVVVPALQAQGTALSSCLEKGKELFSQQQYDKSSEQFAKCVALNPKDVDAQLSLAGSLLTQDKLDEAKEHFNVALKNMERTSPYWSYTYSMLGDIALKQQQNDQALEMYQQSLQHNAANVNSLIGKGVIIEYQGNKKEAAKAYTSALAVEPLNLVARKRLINLEPDYFSDEAILNALKQRYAIAPETTKLTDKDRELFRQIHSAEQRRGVEYLKHKYPKFPPEYTITLNKDTDFAREILSYSGYQALQSGLGQDAVNAFQKMNVPLKDVFSLRDKTGQPVFDENSFLTEAGIPVYSEALKGKKAFLLPNEDVPPTEKEIMKTQSIAQRLKDEGYIEISRSEFAMLQQTTKCPAETLKTDLGVRVVPLTKHRLRYFVQSKTLPATDALKTVPYYYIQLERSKKNPSIQVPKNSVVEYHKYFGHAAICLDDGKPLLQENY